MVAFATRKDSKIILSIIEAPPPKQEQETTGEKSETQGQNGTTEEEIKRVPGGDVEVADSIRYRVYGKAGYIPRKGESAEIGFSRKPVSSERPEFGFAIGNFEELFGSFQLRRDAFLPFAAHPGSFELRGFSDFDPNRRLLTNIETDQRDNGGAISYSQPLIRSWNGHQLHWSVEGGHKTTELSQTNALTEDTDRLLFESSLGYFGQGSGASIR